MRLLAQTLCLCLGLALSRAAPSHHYFMMAADDHHHDDGAHHSAHPDRCDGIEFDAIAPDEKGTTYFFKGDHLWKGFHGAAELSNGTFEELDDHHHLGHVDAAFRMHSEDGAGQHDQIYFFLGDKVFSFYNHTLEAGYPKDIPDVFPGVPGYLDAAVECPSGECTADTVIFFKGDHVYQYDTKTRTVKQKVWSHLPNCTSAFRWLEHYYCFHGHNFTRFHPITGIVEGTYPKDARKYFMKCAEFGHGDKDHAECTNDHLDAIAIDDQGKSYAFIGKLYIRLDSLRDGSHAFPITRNWKELEGKVDAAFSYDKKLYFVQGDQVYIYKSEAHYTLIEGYPKPLKEELGIEGVVDAAFVCKDHHFLYIVQGQKMLSIDLSATPRAVISEDPTPFPKVDAAMCGPKGVTVYVGTEHFDFASPKMLSHSKMKPHPQKTANETLGCFH